MALMSSFFVSGVPSRGRPFSRSSWASLTLSGTSMESLYAVGETACNGVHGRNRLASNSLLESLVFAKRAAGQMAELGFVNDEIAAKKAADSIDLADYSDEKAVEREYRKLAMEAIEGRTSVGIEETIESGIAYIQA